jgi:uncharacterized membrane protein YeaQ/YmgE (transglycosylase-associated protein family)
MWNLIVALIVGGVIGWVAGLIMKTGAQMGIIANIIVGIIGSALGYWLAGVLGMAASGGFMQWVFAIGGAVILIAILKALNIFK